MSSGHSDAGGPVRPPGEGARRTGLSFRVLSACVRGRHARRDNVVIRIRYRDFSAGTHTITGLHGVAKHRAGKVTVYLVPGLTVRERRAVLRRLRQEASRGFGPPLPLLALALALCADKLRTAAGTGAAVIRLHPAVTVLPGAFIAAVMTLFVFASAGRSVEFTPGLPVNGLALSPGGDASQLGGRMQASPLQDRQLFAVVNLGPAQGDDGQLPGLGNSAHGKHGVGTGARGKATGHGKADNGSGSSGNGEGNGGPASGAR